MSGLLPKLKLTKAYYYSNRDLFCTNPDGKLKLRQGWVVTGFLDSNIRKFVIPKTYAGLPIIGIHYFAYEKLTEYKDDNKLHKDGDINTELPVKIVFFSYNMLFVFPPRRYNNRYLVVPTFFVDCNGSIYDKTKNNASLYDAMYFSYARKNTKNLLTDILRNANVPYNCGYSSMGQCVDVWENFDVYAKDKYFGKTDYYKKVTDKNVISINLSQSSETTYKSTYQPRNMNYILNNYVGNSIFDIKKASWKALKVGKYYSLGKHASFSEIQEKFDNRSAVLAFGYMPADNSYAFNLIAGTDVIIQPDFFDVFDVTFED